MAVKLNINKNKNRVVGDLRRTQLITTFGSGAIVDLPFDSVIIAGTDFWTNFDDEESILHEENLESLLGMEYFVKPKVDSTATKTSYAKKSKDVPVFRFPKLLICPKCQKIANYKKFGFNTNPRCTVCKKNLIPSRFVVACENGHLEDFPYSWWVHKGDSSQCKRPEDLIIYNDKKSGGLDSIKIKCNGCNKVRSMDGTFSKTALLGYKCNGNRPWLRDQDTEECNKPMRTLQRGGTNLYFGIHVSSLSIPPWSNKIQDEISKSWNNLFKHIINDENMLKMMITANKIHEKCNCTVNDVISQIKMKAGQGQGGTNKTYEDIIHDEYKAFVSGDYDDKHFKTCEVKVPDYFKEFIDKIVLAKRIREIMVLKGFTRISPYNESDENSSYSKLSKNLKNWLPAIELHGEGIFIKLKSDSLKAWEDKVKDKYIEMERRMNLPTNTVKRNNFSPRYVLLHTLSHTLIRQLTIQCGYSSSALKERIYSTYVNEENSLEMEGILIYTSTSDSEGSLGGLVREGKTENIDNTLRKLLEEASWCSSDPLCIQSTAQGLHSLNYAACHSCALLPETCCESRNSFLDRAALIGTLDDRNSGFFSSLIRDE